MADSEGSGIELTDRSRPSCYTCARGIQSKNAQLKKDSGVHSPIDRIGGVICSDLKGPMTPADRCGNRYMINFVDHASNYCGVFVARKKDQAAKMFEHFLAFFERSFNCKVHILRTDGGGEYRNVDMFCKEIGVTRQVSEAGNQASNGKAERMHRTVLNMARCMLFSSGLPLHFWGDAVQYATYILNRSPSSANLKRASPIEVLNKNRPSLADVVVFGSPCTVYRDPGKKSWKPRAEFGKIVRKNDETKGFKVYLHRERLVITTQHVKHVDTMGVDGNLQLQQQPRREDPGLSQAVETRKKTEKQKEYSSTCKRPCKRGSRGKGRSSKNRVPSSGDDSRIVVSAITRMTTRHMGTKHVPVATASLVEDPKTYREAVQSKDAALWREAMRCELESLKSNKTWEVTLRRPGQKLLHSKWVFKTKRHADGTLERFKTRLVACGNEQSYGVDYTTTFSAVMEMTTAKVVLALARVWGVPARHGDVPNAYVKADKEEDLEIALHVPQGMEFDEHEVQSLGTSDRTKVALKLLKSLYGLKQAGRLWAQLLHDTLVKLGFTQCYTDSCLYTKGDVSTITLVGDYVDDLLVTAKRACDVTKFFDDMKVLEVKDLGEVSKFLGIGVTYTKDSGYRLEQTQCIREMLAGHGLDQAKPARTPIGDEQDGEDEGNLLPSGSDGTPKGPTVKMFQSLIGSLLWLSRCTRPDIAFAVHRASRRAHAPRDCDWRWAKRIVRYLKGTVNLQFEMSGTIGSDSSQDVVVEGYSDADYAADRADRKSVSGGVLCLNGMVVGWMCRKQVSVALSTTEAEFVAASQVASDLLGLCELLGEIGVHVTKPMLMHVDNQAAIKQVQGEDSTGRAKHIAVRLEFIKDYSKKQVIKVEYCESRLMRADLLTKTFAAPRLTELCKLISMV